MLSFITTLSLGIVDIAYVALSWMPFLNYYENILAQDCQGVLEKVLIYVQIGDLFLNQNDYIKAMDQYGK